MIFIIVGLACSNIGCEWWDAPHYGRFASEWECRTKIEAVKDRQIMFFRMDCRQLPATGV